MESRYIYNEMYELAVPLLLKSITGDPKVCVPPAVALFDENLAIADPPKGFATGVVPAFAVVLLDQVGEPKPPPIDCQPVGGKAVALSNPSPVVVCPNKSLPDIAKHPAIT
jgi:hypothetical protein